MDEGKGLRSVDEEGALTGAAGLQNNPGTGGGGGRDSEWGYILMGARPPGVASSFPKRVRVRVTFY